MSETKSSECHNTQTSHEEEKIPRKPVYHRPITSLFLEKATDIQSGATDVLESQGAGYLSS